MKERPILFSGPMVRAILEGRKTMTRRVVKGCPGSVVWNQIVLSRYGGWCDEHGRRVTCPYGKPGDRLWVRETWMPDAPQDGTWADVEFYGCGMRPLSHIPRKYRKAEHCLYRATYQKSLNGWKPSIHMPRWASRITLEVVSVRVERLQEKGKIVMVHPECTLPQAAALGTDRHDCPRFKDCYGNRLCVTHWREIDLPEEAKG